MKILLRLLLVVLLAPAAIPCSMFLIAQAGEVLVGNNEDYWNCDTKVWFVPATEGKRGGVYFGFADTFAQGGMNDGGLCFDGFATGRHPMHEQEGKEVFGGNLIQEAMDTCTTVEEVIELFARHDLRFLETAMLMFADRSGDSVIIEGDEFLRKEGRFQVVTNFYQSSVAPGSDPCPRFRIATGMLEEAEEVSIALGRRVLAAVHNEAGSPTLYSNLYDLKRGLVHIYHFHDFEHAVVFDLAEELKRGARTLELPSLFPEKFAATQFAAKRSQELADQKRKRRARRVDLAILDEYVGRYELTVPGRDPVIFAVRREGETLITRDEEDGEEAEFLAASDNTFFHVNDQGTSDLIFRRDDENRVSGVVLKSMGMTFEGSRLE